MCFVEADWHLHGHHLHGHNISRRGILSASLMASAASATSFFLPGLAYGAETADKNGGPGTAGVNFKWFGTDGWEISFGNRTILIDPYFQRTPTGFFAGKFDPTTQIQVRNGDRPAHHKSGSHSD